MEWTDEQLRIIGHSHGHGRIQAGPGTGKSTTVIALANSLSQDRPASAVRLATFTRAATAELAAKALLDGGTPIQVTTVHSLALQLIVRNSQWSRLPLPIRIPDAWETDELLHDDLRTRLASRWHGLRKTTVGRLEREMAAQWESLDDSRLVADIDPQLRDAYVAAWQQQRAVFGYSLFAEMPWYALELIDDHPDADLFGCEFLIVDEYQDLNRCEIRLVEALAGAGLSIVSVGDEDQSIYSWRMAAPEGIRQFPDSFPGSQDYPLSISQRCARRILEAAQRVINVAPGRNPNLPRPTPADHNPEGEFAYLRFRSGHAEREGVAKLLQHHHDVDGVPWGEMAILVRSDYQARWSKPIREKLASHDIPFADVEAALAPLHTNAARELLAVARLVLQETDDLAWWTILHVRRGVSAASIRAVADFAALHGRRFAAQLMRLEQDTIPGMPAQSRTRATARVNEVLSLLVELQSQSLPETGDWVDWLRDIARSLEITIADDLDQLLNRVAAVATVDQGVREILAQLEPVARDVALEQPGVSIMTVARSKGLTFSIAITMGVEGELFPSPLSDVPEEDRRLLYVAITRARRASYLTMARFRTDGTAYTGSGDSVNSRSRCNFLSQASIEPRDGHDYLDALG